MKRYRRIVSLISMVVLVVGTASASPAAAEVPDSTPEQPVQLSLGDSWAAGVGADVPSEGGYVPRLYEALKEDFDCSPAADEQAVDGCKHLQLVNLAEGGATTPSLIARQLPDAENLLASRNDDSNPTNDVEVITLHIGGNDVTDPIIAACLGGLGASCLQVIQAEFTAYRADLNTALSALRGAAGTDTRIVMGTYDNPIPTCDLAAVPGAILLANLVLEGGGPVPQGLHDIMRDVADDDDYDVEVASVFGELEDEDWVGGQDCLHPDDSGYVKVAEAFRVVLAS